MPVETLFIVTFRRCVADCCPWAISIPSPEKFSITTFSKVNSAPSRNLTPSTPRVVPAPLMLRLRRITLSVDRLVVMLITKPFSPLASTDPQPEPVPPSIVIALVMVSVPKPPGSRTSISPPVAVLEMAPEKVLHGAVRLHGSASLPTPDTQVRVAWAWAIVTNARVNTSTANALIVNRNLVIRSLLPYV